MTDLRKAAEMALEALNSKYIVNCGAWMLQQDQAAEALRQALAQPVDAVNITQDRVDETVKSEREPLCYLRDDIDRSFGGFEDCDKDDAGAFPVYTAPPKRQWVGLTDEEVAQIADSEWEEAFVRLIEAKLKEKNGG